MNGLDTLSMAPQDSLQIIHSPFEVSTIDFPRSQCIVAVLLLPVINAIQYISLHESLNIISSRCVILTPKKYQIPIGVSQSILRNAFL